MLLPALLGPSPAAPPRQFQVDSGVYSREAVLQYILSAYFLRRLIHKAEIGLWSGERSASHRRWTGKKIDCNGDLHLIQADTSLCPSPPRNRSEVLYPHTPLNLPQKWIPAIPSLTPIVAAANFWQFFLFRALESTEPRWVSIIHPVKDIKTTSLSHLLGFEHQVGLEFLCSTGLVKTA